MLDRKEHGQKFGETEDIYNRWKSYFFSTKFKVLLKLLTLNFIATSESNIGGQQNMNIFQIFCKY